MNNLLFCLLFFTSISSIKAQDLATFRTDLLMNNHVQNHKYLLELGFTFVPPIKTERELNSIQYYLKNEDGSCLISISYSDKVTKELYIISDFFDLYNRYTTYLKENFKEVNSTNGAADKIYVNQNYEASVTFGKPFKIIHIRR